MEEALYQAYKFATIKAYLIKTGAFFDLQGELVCACGTNFDDADVALMHLRKHRPELFIAECSQAKKKYWVKAKGVGN